MSPTRYIALAAFAAGAIAGPNVHNPPSGGGWSPTGWGGPSQSWHPQCPLPTPSYASCGSFDQAPQYHRNTSFAYPLTPYPGTATSVSAGPISTYAVAYSQVTALFSNVSTTSWPNWTPVSSAAPTAAASEPYGDEAYSALWNAANPVNFTRGIYSTTASPTPIPTSELVKPPPLYFKPSSCYKFPKDFVFGTAGSAGQCEGATADEGKSPSFLDMVANILLAFGQAASTSVTGVGVGEIVSNAVTLEHFYLYKQDIDRLAAAGIKHFYLTISWTRILPFALPGTPVNSYGIDHYNDVINYILSKGMIPAVAITHFDTPLQFYGGGAEYLTQVAEAAITGTYGLGGVDFGYNNATFEDAYVNYAKIVLSHYADRVPIWITFNEPQVGSVNAQAVVNVLRAHARTYRFYKDELKGIGQMSIKMGITPAVPLDASQQADVEAAQYFTDLYTFPYLYPTVLGTQLPDAFLKTLPDARPLTDAELTLMNGTMDFVSIDGYSAPVIKSAVSDLAACAADHNGTRPFPICVNATTINNYGWSTGYSPAGSPTDYMEPYTLRTQLNQVWSTFGKPIFVTEFGLSVPVPPGGRLQDNLYNVPQSEYLLSYLDQMLTAIWEDGVHVAGAFVWNFLDDWEFGFEDHGYGLMYLNWTTKERRYRRSIFDVVDFVESRRQT